MTPDIDAELVEVAARFMCTQVQGWIACSKCADCPSCGHDAREIIRTLTPLIAARTRAETAEKCAALMCDGCKRGWRTGYHKVDSAHTTLMHYHPENEEGAPGGSVSLHIPGYKG